MAESDDVVYQYTDAQGRVHRVANMTQVPKDRIQHMLVIGGEEARLEATAHEGDEPLGPTGPPPAEASIRPAKTLAVVYSDAPKPAPAAEGAPAAAGANWADGWLVPGALVLAALASGNTGVRAAFVCAAVGVIFLTGKVGLQVGDAAPERPGTAPVAAAAATAPDASAAAAEPATAPPEPVGPPTLPITLASVDGNSRDALGPCRAAKCLTIYLAPWCPACQATTPRFIAMRKFLASRGVPAYVVVGAADFADCLEYARQFGPDAMIDPERTLERPGYPDFIITDSRGSIISERPGNLESDDMESQARSLGLI